MILFKRDFDYRKSSIFLEYAPMVFERIRKSFGVKNDDYLRSVGPEQLVVMNSILMYYFQGDLLFGNLSSLTEKVSSGKSGSFFYYSFDDKYMLKTISRDEYLFFKNIIRKYYEHLLINYDTMIIK
jgi:1-phosphatidylinositol-4-phosphate 5-kinase